MAKPRIPNQRSKYKALKARLNKYVLLAQAAVMNFVADAVQSLAIIDYDGKEEFEFDKHPTIKGQIAEKRAGLLSQLFGIFMTGTALEWAASNKVQDTVADKVLSAYGGKKVDKYYKDNEKALRSFQSRVYSGHTTYGRLEEISDVVKKEVEIAISASAGQPLAVVKTKVEKYFGDVDSLRHDFKEKFGHEPIVQDGQFQAQRLLRSEINMAYRTAEQQRWMQLDFVVGYEIKLSHMHHDRMPKGDICDLLAGKYPKEFIWSGWHINDLCYCVPILKTEDEYLNDSDSKNQVTEFPEAFGKWIDEHQDKIGDMARRGKLPYWIKDNKDVKDCAVLISKAHEVGDVMQASAEAIALAKGGAVTPINYKSFSSMYRKLTNPNEPMVIADMKDAVRNTIVVDKGGIEGVIEELKRLDTFWRYKPQSTDYGYTGNIVNLQMPNGIKAEIQVNTPRMIYAKEKPENAKRVIGEDLWNKIHEETGLEGGLGHHYYEIGRKMNPGPELEEIMRKSREYYAHFS